MHKLTIYIQPTKVLSLSRFISFSHRFSVDSMFIFSFSITSCYLLQLQAGFVFASYFCFKIFLFFTVNIYCPFFLWKFSIYKMNLLILLLVLSLNQLYPLANGVCVCVCVYTELFDQSSKGILFSLPTDCFASPSIFNCSTALDIIVSLLHAFLIYFSRFLPLILSCCFFSLHVSFFFLIRNVSF